MTYAAAFTAKADRETVGLPQEAFVALVDQLAVVCRDPWGATAPDILDDPAFRWTSFGEFGLVSVYVDDARGVVRVHDVTWAG